MHVEGLEKNDRDGDFRTDDDETQTARTEAENSKIGLWPPVGKLSGRWKAHANFKSDKCSLPIKKGALLTLRSFSLT